MVSLQSSTAGDPHPFDNMHRTLGGGQCLVRTVTGQELTYQQCSYFNKSLAFV
jgi:hypothetical protein